MRHGQPSLARVGGLLGETRCAFCSDNRIALYADDASEKEYARAAKNLMDTRLCRRSGRLFCGFRTWLGPGPIRKRGFTGLVCRSAVPLSFRCGWYPLIQERNDGIDTLKWLLAQPWQNGKIGLWGSSYPGLAKWAVADELPPK